MSAIVDVLSSFSASQLRDLALAMSSRGVEIPTQRLTREALFAQLKGERAGITQPRHPHLFRHQMLTYLTAQGLSDAQIQLISGHESKKSLEIYEHLSLKSVEQAYQEAVRLVVI